MLAAKSKGAPLAIRKLLELGADSSLKNSSGLTALDLAKKAGVPANILALEGKARSN